MTIRVTYVKEYEDVYCSYCGDDINNRLVRLNNIYVHLECWYPYIQKKLLLLRGMTVNQQAKLFNVTVRTIYRWRDYNG